MRQDCEHYGECRRPTSQCNGNCPDYKKFCSQCLGAGCTKCQPKPKVR